jgi:hypothetical protein
MEDARVDEVNVGKCFWRPVTLELDLRLVLSEVCQALGPTCTFLPILSWRNGRRLREGKIKDRASSW